MQHGCGGKMTDVERHIPIRAVKMVEKHSVNKEWLRQTKKQKTNCKFEKRWCDSNPPYYIINCRNSVMEAHSNSQLKENQVVKYNCV